MSKKEIYLIRHGETEYNKKGIVQGSGIDADLNETGRNQAEAFHRKYGDVAFQKVYTSALVRTHQTVENLMKSAGAKRKEKNQTQKTTFTTPISQKAGQKAM
jgi:probable phosphoglycerate mutase